MNDLVEEYDTKYHTRSLYGVKLDQGRNVKSLKKKLNYRPQRSNTNSSGLESFLCLGDLGISDDTKHAKDSSCF